MLGNYFNNKCNVFFKKYEVLNFNFNKIKTNTNLTFKIRKIKQKAPVNGYLFLN